MKSITTLIFLAHLVHGQVETSITATPTLETTTSLDNSSPTASGEVTPSVTSSDLLTTTGSSIESAITGVTTEDNLSISTNTALSVSSSLTGTINSTATATDDDTEITTTGTIQPESTADGELGNINEVPRELTPDESVAVTALEVETYADLLVNNPVAPSSDDTPEESVIALPACPVSGTALAKRLDKPPKKPVFYPCMPNKLTLDVIYHYVQSDVKDAANRTIIRTRVGKQHSYFVRALALYGIVLENGEVQFKTPTIQAQRFTDHYKSNQNTAEAKTTLADYNAYRRKTRVGGAETLNVWIVEKLRNDKPNFRLNGYAQFPEYRQFETDGIVISWQALRSEDDKIANSDPKRRGSVLIHEFGHWMGLYHTFGDTPCRGDDGIADTYYTSNAEPYVYDDYQELCGTNIVTFRWISNYMSYSKVRGSNEGKADSVKLKAFTKGQRAAMFARFHAFRAGVIYSADYCKQKSKRDLVTREEAHFIQRRAEDKAKALADLLISNCSIAIQDVYQEETIPLPSSALASYKSVASSMAANPTSKPADLFAPKTASIGTGTAVAAPTGSGSGGSNAAQTGTRSLGVSAKANGLVAVMVSALCWLMLA